MIDKLSIVPFISGDATSDAVTVAAMIGLAVILLVNLVIDSLPPRTSSTRPRRGRTTPTRPTSREVRRAR